MSLALDERKENDEIHEVGGFTFLIEKALMEHAAPIKVDLTYTGFTVSSNLQMGGGSCGGSCSSC